MEQKQVSFNRISIERIEQVTKHNRSLQNDRLYRNGQLLKAAEFCTSLNKKDWPKGWLIRVRDNIASKGIADRLIYKAAFIAAEVDRLNGIDDWRFGLEADRYSDYTSLKDFIRKKEDEIKVSKGFTLFEKVTALVHHYSWTASTAVADKKDCIEKMKVYLQAMLLLADGVAMASTHGEKSSRLRGMIEVMNNTISKLNDQHTDEILTNWKYGMHSRSDFPYREILSKYETMKNENEHLKKQVEQLTNQSNDKSGGVQTDEIKQW